MSRRPTSSRAIQRQVEKARRDIERQRRKRMAVLLTRYRTIDAVFEESETEVLLRQGCEEYDSTDEDYEDDVYEDVMDAYPLPGTVAELWREYHGWEEILDDRYTFQPEYETPEGIFYRMLALEDLLDRTPAGSFQDIMARLNGMEALVRAGRARDIDEDVVLINRLRSDVTEMYARMGGK